MGRSRAGAGASRSHSGRSGPSRTNHSAAARRVQSNHRKGIAFEKRVTTAVKHSSQTKIVKTQVPTRHHGRADIVAKSKSGQKVVIEAKNFRGNPVTKANVKQVCGYAKDLHAKPKLVVSKSTTVPNSTKKFAEQKSVTITKM